MENCLIEQSKYITVEAKLIQLNYPSHLKTAKQLLSLYKLGLPFSLYLKKYFRINKKHGSRDRKLISALCYNYFRLGFALKNIPVEDRIILATILVDKRSSEQLQFKNARLDDSNAEQQKQKATALHSGFSFDDIFPFKKELSKDIDAEKFTISLLNQPKLFLRIRPGFKDSVIEKLNKASVTYQTLSEKCIALINSSKIDSVIDLDREAVVQDYNSQRVGEFIESAIIKQHSKIKVWDCCAASGGKSIMAYDIDTGIQLTVSDIRENILLNLKNRFMRAGIKNYLSFVTDLTLEKRKLPIDKFDIIIADLPCTGSGTWSRTPEQLFYFNEKQIEKYSNTQKQILENVLSYLTKGGYLLYVTCSVFRKENEDVVNFLTEKFKLEIIRMEMLKGYEMQADSMFAALFKVC